MLDDYGKLYTDVDLTNYNTYHIKTYAKYLIIPKTIDNLINIIKYAKENKLKFFILGNGSNVILPDNKFEGIIVSVKELCNIKMANDMIYADAGVMLPVLSKSCIDSNLKRLEWSIGIPGTLGGAIYGNAGAYLSCIMDYVKDVIVLDDNYHLVKLDIKDIPYSYRHTLFKDNKKYIILGADLKLSPGNKEESLLLVNDRRNRRLASQPLEYPSAGSVFRNPEPQMPAGKLIEEAGLKGKKVGDAQVSLKHANFIINKGHASANDIKKLIRTIQDIVKEKDNIDLECEQEIIDWN